jgi:TolA-binding protein
MKRTLYVLIIAGLFLSGCANDQYSIEREYWKVNRQAQAIFKNPVATPPNERDRAIAVIRNFIASHPNNILAVRAEFTIGRIYLVTGLYDEARKQFNSISAKYAKSATIVSESIFSIGSSYQLQKNTEDAVAQYKTIISRFPLSPRGLQMPIYIAQYYAGLHDPVKMQESYKEAITQYQKLAQKDMKSALALRSYTLIAECYAGLKDWQKSIDSLEMIVTNFKDRASMDGVLLNIAVIYRRELRDMDKAKDVLMRLIKEYPDSRYAKAAQELLKKP